jgi:hypothetical protein
MGVVPFILNSETWSLGNQTSLLEIGSAIKAAELLKCSHLRSLCYLLDQLPINSVLVWTSMSNWRQTVTKRLEKYIALEQLNVFKVSKKHLINRIL